MTTSHVSSGFAGIDLSMWGMRSISSLTALHSRFSVSIDHARLFVEQETVRGFMNQDSQKGVLNFNCDCLEHDLLLASLVGAVAP